MPDIIDAAIAHPHLKTLVAAVKAAGLVDTLKSPGPFTVFAPLDSAFEKLPPGTVETLLQNIPQLSRILTYHVVPGLWRESRFQERMTLISVEGSPLSVQSQDHFEVKNAAVVAADIELENGIVHCIDTVLLMG
ncbi:fasciclin domain-containing protein [Lyngbya confervoides]|uniref:Fasciclin domain-containing protein n=1 Tax=Lyngbya confervoides BDU141951 TaxID=1574623 RepID=A0ABD4T5C8_9CYAN|nr:fasciclin domain-containing protein [Lyngbya confervoides]MCM1983912.1 fasciclin domain-containing protein [Lyngbya confervoides BDU141951]